MTQIKDCGYSYLLNKSTTIFLKLICMIHRPYTNEPDDLNGPFQELGGVIDLPKKSDNFLKYQTLQNFTKGDC